MSYTVNGTTTVISPTWALKATLPLDTLLDPVSAGGAMLWRVPEGEPCWELRWRQGRPGNGNERRRDKDLTIGKLQAVGGDPL